MKSARSEVVDFRSCSKCGHQIPQSLIQNYPKEYPCGRCGEGTSTAKVSKTKTRLLREVMSK